MFETLEIFNLFKDKYRVAHDFICGIYRVEKFYISLKDQSIELAWKTIYANHEKQCALNFYKDLINNKITEESFEIIKGD